VALLHERHDEDRAPMTTFWPTGKRHAALPLRPVMN
jgi:hypothetical protein